MRKKVLNIGRNIKINTSDTKIATQGIGYLPGGTMSIVWDHLADLIIKTCNADKLGRWSSITIGRDSQII